MLQEQETLKGQTKERLIQRAKALGERRDWARIDKPELAALVEKLEREQKSIPPPAESGEAAALPGANGSGNTPQGRTHFSAMPQPGNDDRALEAEQSVLGGLLLAGADGADHTAAALKRVNGLRPEHFNGELHRRIFQAILDCAEDDGVSDLVTVADRLERNGERDPRLAAYLGSMAQNIPSALNVHRYAELVREHAERRKLAAVADQFAERAHAPGVNVAEAVRELEAQLTVIKAANINSTDLLALGFWVRDAKVTTDLPYVVKRILGKGMIGVVWGRPGSGKTFAAMEISCCVGSGVLWHGRRTRKGAALYVVAESSRAYIENRIAALKRERPELAEAAVLVAPLSLDLLHRQAGDVDRVIATAKRIGEQHGDVALIVVDTLATTFGGGNENAPEDMGLYVGNILRIRHETGAAVLLVHHAGKDEAKGMRGHSALLGALDAELTVEGEPGNERILRTGKVRDGDGYIDLFAFSLRPVDLGTDSDGEQVSTCVIDAKGPEETRRARQQQQRKGGGLGKHQRHALRVLEAAGGTMVRIDLAHKLKEEGMPRNRVHDAIGGLLDSGMLLAHNDREPPEVSLP